MAAPQRMSIPDAAEAFGISYTVLWQAVRGDELPAIQLGRKWLVRPEDVEAWIVANGEPNEAERNRDAS